MFLTLQDLLDNAHNLSKDEMISSLENIKNMCNRDVKLSGSDLEWIRSNAISMHVNSKLSRKLDTDNETLSTTYCFVESVISRLRFLRLIDFKIDIKIKDLT